MVASVACQINKARARMASKHQLMITHIQIINVVLGMMMLTQTLIFEDPPLIRPYEALQSFIRPPYRAL